MVIIEGYFKAEVPEIPMENCRPGKGFIITLSLAHWHLFTASWCGKTLHSYYWKFLELCA